MKQHHEFINAIISGWDEGERNMVTELGGVVREAHNPASSLRQQDKGQRSQWETHISIGSHGWRAVSCTLPVLKFNNALLSMSALMEFRDHSQPMGHSAGSGLSWVQHGGVGILNYRTYQLVFLTLLVSLICALGWTRHTIELNWFTSGLFWKEKPVTCDEIIDPSILSL